MPSLNGPSLNNSSLNGPLFSLRNLTRVFPGGGEEGGVRAVDGVNLDIFSGECLVVAGSNGSGKTVLMKMMAGLLEPSSGEVLFRGRPPGTVSRCPAAGLVFQDADAQLIGETVLEDAMFGPKNLGLPGPEALRRAREALDAMGLGGKADYSPRLLSGGEKRRLAVAGVLAMGCETVIMDEPFANLDWPGVVHALESIRELKARRATVIILTHELEKVLAFADRLVILHRGRVRDDGEPEAVLDRLDGGYGVRDPRRVYHDVRDCTWLD